MLERIQAIRAEAEAAIAAAADVAALEEARVRYLGRKSELTTILRGVGELEPAERGPVGSAANAARVALEEALAERRDELEAAELTARLEEDRIDVTMPGTPPVAAGNLHLLTRTRREIEDVFVGLGYQVMEGPEIEHDYYNFTALNHPPGHPARLEQDSFYVDPSSLPEGVRNHDGLPPRPPPGGAPAPPGAPPRAGRPPPAPPSPRGGGGGGGTPPPRRSSSSPRDRSTAATRSTRPTCRCSIRSRAWRWPRESRWRISP